MAEKKLDVILDVKGAHEAERKLKGLGETLHDIKQKLGKRSELGEVLELFKGAGAVGAISLVGRHLGEAGEAAQKMIEQFRTGDATVGDFVESLAGAIPIYGEIWQGGRKVHAALSDGIAATLEWAGASESVVRYWESGETALKRATAEAEKLAILNAEFRKESGPNSDSKLLGLRGFNLDLGKIYAEAGQRAEAIQAERAQLAQDVRDKKISPSAESGEMAKLKQRETDSEKRRVQESDDLIVKYQMARKTAAVRSEAEIAGIKAASQAAELKALGKTYDAEALLINTAANNQEELLKRAAKEQMQNAGPLDKKLIAERTRNQIAALRQGRADALNQANLRAGQNRGAGTVAANAAEEGKTEARFQMERSLAQIRIDGLRLEASLGRDNKAIEAERLAIHEEFLKKDHELIELSKAAYVTAKEQRDIDAARSNLKKQQQDALLKVMEGAPHLNLTSALNGELLTGAHAAAAERNPYGGLEKRQDTTNRKLDLLITKIGDFAETFKASPPIKVGVN
jgi:hypothetical protein